MAIADDDLRKQAEQRLVDRRDFSGHLVAYLVVNGMLTAIWAFSGAGYFWPAWVLFGWGIGLILHAWDVFFRRPITESDIEHEMERMRHAR